jgi:hypothetical protein
MKKIVSVTTFSLTFVLACLSIAAQTQAESREDVIQQIEAKRAELAVLEKKILSVSNADREENATLLSQPDTGIIRLLPRETYDGAKKRGLAINGGGAFYSFALAKHEYGQGSDIMLEQGDFSCGFAGADYGMLLNLGDVPLDQVVADHVSVRALFEYMPTSAEPDARKAQRALWQGMDLSGVVFKNRMPAKVSNTYLLRSVNFGGYDIAVAFRVTRKDTDGSMILLFKVLKRFPKPDLERTQAIAQ